MANVKDVARRLIANLQELRRNQKAETFRISLDLIALVRLRIQTTGEDFTNAPFAPYTPGYADQRALAGYQIDHVDFTRTGALMASLQPIVERVQSDVITIAIGPTGQDNIDKYEGAQSKRGNIFLPSQDEIAIVGQSNVERISKYLII